MKKKSFTLCLRKILINLILLLLVTMGTELLLKKSPDVLKGAKKLIDQSWVAPNGEGLRIESDIQGSIMGYENNMEAVMATIQKRPAKFK